MSMVAVFTYCYFVIFELSMSMVAVFTYCYFLVEYVYGCCVHILLFFS